MFSNNFVQLCANIIFYLVNVLMNNDNTLRRVLVNPSLRFDVIMIGLSGALG